MLRGAEPAPRRRMRAGTSCDKAFEVLAALGADDAGGVCGAAGAAICRRGSGRRASRCSSCARGIDPRPLVPDPGVPRFLESMELEWPIDGLEPLSFVFARLLDPLSAALERADRGAAAIRLDLRLTIARQHTRMLQLPAAMRDPRVLRTLLLLDLESHPPSAAIDIVTIEIDPAPGRIAPVLAARARAAVGGNAGDADRAARRAGRQHRAVGAPRCSIRIGPDAFEMRPFAPDERSHAARRSLAVGRRRMPRPHRRAICRVRAASARRWRSASAVERGRPVRVAIDRHGMPGGRVEQCAGPWRSSGPGGTRDGRLGSRRVGCRVQRRLGLPAVSRSRRRAWFLEECLTILHCDLISSPIAEADVHRAPHLLRVFLPRRRVAARSARAARRGARLSRARRCSIATASTARRAFISPRNAPG